MCRAVFVTPYAPTINLIWDRKQGGYDLPHGGWRCCATHGPDYFNGSILYIHRPPYIGILCDLTVSIIYYDQDLPGHIRTGQLVSPLQCIFHCPASYSPTIPSSTLRRDDRQFLPYMNWMSDPLPDGACKLSGGPWPTINEPRVIDLHMLVTYNPPCGTYMSPKSNTHASRSSFEGLITQELFEGEFKEGTRSSPAGSTSAGRSTVRRQKLLK